MKQLCMQVAARDRGLFVLSGILSNKALGGKGFGKQEEQYVKRRSSEFGTNQGVLLMPVLSQKNSPS
jgi:hypothetical protein